MAISLKTAGTWARMVTDNGTVAIPGTPAAGDRMFLFGSWKTYTITVVTPSGWTLIDDFSDGAVAAGNGTGSVHNAVYYRDWQSGDAAPAIDYSAAPTEGHWVIMLWQKGAGDTWGTPLAANGAIAAATPFAVSASATLTVPSLSVVMAFAGLRDDSTTLTHTTGDITGNGLTWLGSDVESPAAHFNSTTGQDMSGDLGHRFVNAGAAGVTLAYAGSPAAAETGTATWIVQGVSSGTTTPITVAATSTFTPTVARLSTFQRALAATSTFSPTLARTLSLLRTLAVGSAFTVSLARQITVTLAVVSTFAPVLVVQKVFLRLLAAASTLVPGLGTSLVMSRTLAVGSSMSVVVTKQVNKTLAVATPLIVGMQRSIYITLAVTSSFVVEMRRSFYMTLAVASSFGAALVTRYTHLQSLAVSGGVWTAGLVTQFIAGGAGQIKSWIMLLTGVGRK